MTKKPKVKIETIKPFAETGNYIAVHKICFRVIMPSLSPSAWKCLCLVLFKTEGWGKISDPIAYSQIREGTGIKTDVTICKAMMELRGYSRADGTKNGQWLRDPDMPQYVLAFESKSAEIGLTYALNRQVEIPLPKEK